MPITIGEVRKKYPEYGDLSDQQLADALHAKFYSDIPKPDFYAKVGLASQPAAPAPAGPQKRSALQRLVDDAGEAITNGSFVADARRAFLKPDSVIPDVVREGMAIGRQAGSRIYDAFHGIDPAPPPPAPEPAQPMSFKDKMNAVLSAAAQKVPGPLDQTPGLKLGIAGAGVIDEALNPGHRAALVQAERTSRAAQAARSQADPWNKADNPVLHGGAALLGTLLGGATDPMNLAPGTGAEGLLLRAGELAGQNAVSDVVTQGADLASGVRDKYSAEQTALAAAMGPIFAVGGHVFSKFFAERGKTPAEVTPEDVGEMMLNPETKDYLAAQGITPDNPKAAPFAAAYEQKVAREAAARDPQPIIAQATAAPEITPEIATRLQALQEGPNVAPTTRADVGAVLAGDADPSRIRAPEPAPLPETIPVDAAGRAMPVDDPALREGFNQNRPQSEPPVRPPPESPPPRPAEFDLVAEAKRRGYITDEAAAPKAEAPPAEAPKPQEAAPPPRAEAPPTEAPQAAPPAAEPLRLAGPPEPAAKPEAVATPEPPTREAPPSEPMSRARQAFSEWDAELRQRATQLDTEYQAKIDAAPHRDAAIDLKNEWLKQRGALNREFSRARSMLSLYGSLSPAEERHATLNDRISAGDHWYRHSSETSRMAIENMREAFASFHEAMNRYRQRQSDAGWKRQEQAAKQAYAEKDVASSSIAAPVDAEGRFATDEFGHVASDKGGPIRFGDQKQAAKWILNVGQKESPDQFFEIANHPKGGFTAREVGRSEPKTTPGADESPHAVSPAPAPAEHAGPTEAARAVHAPEAEPSPARAEPRRDRASGAPEKTPASDVGSQEHPDAGMSDEEVARLHEKSFGPGRKLYSNPADPEAIKELLLDPAVKAIKREIDGFKSDLDQVKADVKGFSSSASPAAALDTAARTLRKVWWSNTAAIRAVADKYKDVPEVRQLADWIGTDPGRGRVVEQTYERAVQMRAMGMANRLQNILGDKVKPALETKVADVLAGRARALGGTAEEEMARRMRKLLDEQHDYMKEAGLDVGYVKGRYYPRVVDEDAVMKDAAGFKAKAAEVYRRMGLDAKEAEQAGEDWYARILGVSDGAYMTGLASSRHTKGRTLPPEADRILADFYVKDPRANLTAYFRQTSRAAEFARRFGADGSKADELFNSMLKKGVPPKEVENLRHHFESATGQLYATRPDAGASALSWIQTAGVLRLLPRAVISSSVEALSVGVRAHDVGAGFKALADSYATVFGLREHDDMTKAAEMLGIVGDAMNDLVISSQFGGEVGGQLQRKILARFFRVTHLHQITEAQRLAAARVGQGMIRTLLQDMEGGKRQKSAARLLAELGMDEAGAKSVGKWLAGNGGMPPLAELTGTKREAVLYRTALQRFVDESIQNPTAADRPQWANHPFGRLAYGITSFMFSFTRNVLVRTARETGEGLLGKGYTLEDRARLLAPAVALGVLTAAQSEVSELRDQLLSPQAYAQRTKAQQLVTNLSRSGAFGNADPFINIAMSARYNRDLTSTLTGPYLTAYLDSISKLTIGLIPKSLGGPNTPNTNNAEWQAAKAGYDMVVAPSIAAAASYAPGGPILRLGYGAGMVAASSPGASAAFADKVAGPRTITPRGRSVGNSDNELDESPDMSYDDGDNGGEE